MSVREGYKQTEIGVIPEEWEVANLAKIVKNMHQGINTVTEKIHYEDNGIDILQAKHITSGFIDFSDPKKISEETYKKYSDKYQPLINHILLTNIGTIGKVLLVKSDMRFLIAWNLFLIKADISLVNPCFLFSIFQRLDSEKYYDKFLTGNATKFINKKFLSDMVIPLPPLSEQQKIAEILSTVDQKIDSIDSKIEETQTLKRGLMQRLLSEGIGHSEFKDSEIGRIPAGWEVDRLENHVTIVSGQSPSSFDLYGEQYKFFKVNQLNFCTKYLYESEYAFDISNYNNLHSGTVIFPKRGASIFTNKVRILATEGYIDTNLMGLITKKTLNNEYLYYWLISFELSNIADTSSIPQINNKHINPLKFPLPPLEEQKQIAEILSTTDEKLETLRAKKEAFETLKKGLMQKLLSGEVRV